MKNLYREPHTSFTKLQIIGIWTCREDFSSFFQSL